MSARRNRHVRVAMATCATSAVALIAASPLALAAPGSGSSNGTDKITYAAGGAVRSITPGDSRPTVGNAAVSKELAAKFNSDKSAQFRKVRGQALGSGSVARFQQVIGGHVVFGSSITNAVDKQGKLIQSMGNVATGTTGAFPAAQTLQKNSAAAQRTAKSVTEAKGATAKVVDTVWFAPSVAGAASASARTEAEPAYQISVSAPSEGWKVIVSANDTTRILAATPTQYEINRAVCDANRYQAIVVSDLRCGKGFRNTLTRSEGSAPSSVVDANSVYTFFGDTSSFYARNTAAGDLTALIGVDYRDGVGKALRASVRQCISGEACPYANAFWRDDISAMVYGEGVSTDDVTGHEMTHGVTSNTNGLAYENEAGAINESMSDIFGEFMDLGNGSADDTAANRWKIGEGSSLGVIRDMKTPTSHQQPDTYKGTYWQPTTTNPTENNDYGGVHTNSGVGNKAAQLLVDGGSLNGTTVTGIGIGKASQIYWTAQTMLTSNATYSSLGTALKQACSANVTNGVAGTTSADCTQVANALRAVKVA
ncbi:M4 family metallopeptidase [Flexivirga sp. ID2601S]|uniref:Neutral metalloproteinase n=1 Tax=Flexivirga aerilata TaxID=1656889 RepID=A0A849AK00_9MICO|nr:M4 family metallopeptidase [Flexivirga aerilata]NNG38720.1 M4 family metallopeptidase [Flexivirga aerilata]